MGIIVSVNKIKRLLRRLGFKWKRYRKSLKIKRDEGLFRLFQEEIKQLEEMAKTGEIDLMYFDGSGFNLNPNVPYGWLPLGQQITLPANRGNGWTVLAAINIQNDQVEAQIYEGAATAKCVIKFFDDLCETLTKKTIVILDNASIHKANLVKDKQKGWAEKNLFLQFIPAYSPELNKIEIFWKQMKHSWLEVPDYQSRDALYKAIFRVFNNYGSKYRISFN